MLPLQVSSLGVEGEGIWLALGTVGMSLGKIISPVPYNNGTFMTPSRTSTTSHHPYRSIAASSYLTMFFGFGLTEVELVNGRVIDVYWARYADWLFTTPLLLLDIGLLAGASNRDMASLITIDAFMIVTGLAATLMKVPVARSTSGLSAPSRSSS